MERSYHPQRVEERWYTEWEQQGVFSPEYRPHGRPFCMVIPPPNVTGSLHIGHALNHTIHDVIVRRKRMQGWSVLWIPGSDHAGIATQAAVERSLRSAGQDRHQLGREAFVERVWKWKKEYGNTITNQIRRLGNSCDWSRERFTLDNGLSAAVREVFVTLFEQGLIYRGDRIINWCIQCGTALADIEVDYSDTTGEMCQIFYPAVTVEGGITVATTRAETMLGDTGVAVNPADPRYRSLVGQQVRLPLVGRHIPVVADEAVDPDFGTGAVKVTPAHDLVDHEIAARHGLEPITVLDQMGVTTPTTGEFAGLDRETAREQVKQALRRTGELVSVEPQVHSVGRCYRCDTVVEPLLSRQWFVRVQELAPPAVSAVQEQRCRFVPSRWEKSYFHWMENLRDWCISRQIWWGHRIPAWYCQDCEQITVSRADPDRCRECGSGALQQDSDVLDTWFSSALWPFSTLGWPEQTTDLERFYPNTVLVTGFDIINFWVARMLMMGLHFLSEVPFTTTVVHGLVRDVTGRKMSKSLGNTIDPLEIIEQEGADPLRLALLQSTNLGQDIPFDPDWVKGARKFGNKLWNAVRFTITQLGNQRPPPQGGYSEHPAPAAAWILSRLGEVAARFDRACDQYRFSEAFSLLYNFTWSEVCDWYLEMSKIEMARPDPDPTIAQTLGLVMRDLLKLWHPAIPFLTEELWGELVGVGLLAGSDWPEVPPYSGPEQMEDLMELITGVRRFRSEHEISPKETLRLGWLDRQTRSPDWATALVAGLANVETHSLEKPPETGHAWIPTSSVEGFLALTGVVDLEVLRASLDRQRQSLQSEIVRSKGKLNRPQFVEKAPAEIVAKERNKLAEFSLRMERIQQQQQYL